MIGSVTGEREFSTAGHILVLREERCDRKKIHDDANKSKLKGLVDALEEAYLRLIICAKNTGSWLTVQGTKVTGTVLEATEFCDFCTRVIMLPSPTLKKYNSCYLYLSVHHRLSCSNRGLVIARHNKVRDELL